MLRSCLAIALLLAALGAPFPVHSESLPIIVGYELNKQRQERRIIARNPKAFWVHQIVARIEDKKRDLPKPLKEGVTVQVSFIVGRDGHLVSKAVTASSGNPDADKTAIAMLEDAQPFPPMPEAMSDTQLSFVLPVRFQ